jgi:hypothetical protein
MYMRGSDDERLDALLHAFRDACPAPEASANFMPNLWQRIEARQSFTFSFGRMAGAFVTAALALSLALGVFLSLPSSSAYYSQSYVEALADQDSNADFVEPVRLEVR